MKNDDQNFYQPFYVEIPQTDYLKDIEIQDEYERETYDSSKKPAGLSKEQVSQIARDSLGVSTAIAHNRNVKK